MPPKKQQPTYFDALTFQPLESPPPDALRLGATPAASYLVGPALFDPQINGYAGVDFQDPDVTAAGLEHAVETLRREGCPHILLTLVTTEPTATLDQLRRLSAFIAQSPLLSSSILGIHLEGPFISADQAYAGAHPAALTRDPQWSLFLRWQKASGGRVRLVTLAPEREGSLEFIAHAVRSGVAVSLGHTDATSAQLWAAAEAGAWLFTHLGNGCPGLLARHDNIIQRVLAVPDLQVMVIADGIHIPPPALANLLRALGPARVALTTDAMAAASSPPGRYRMGELEVVVGADRVVRNPSGSGLAGSALRPIDGLYNVIRFGGLGADAAWRAWIRLRRQLFPDLVPPTIMVPFTTG